MCYNGNRTVSELSLLNRLHLIRTSVISPIHSLDVKLPFEIRMKPMYNIEQTVFVWNDVVKELSHESDGLIFTPIEDPYQAGSCFRLLKWKPISLNSVDFKIYAEYIRLFGEWDQAEDSVCYRLQALRDGIDVNFDWISFEGKEEEALYGHSGLIVECVFDEVGGKWSELRAGSMDVCAILEWAELGPFAQI